MQQLLGDIFPDPGKGKIGRTRFMEAADIAAYWNYYRKLVEFGKNSSHVEATAIGKSKIHYPLMQAVSLVILA